MKIAAATPEGLLPYGLTEVAEVVAEDVFNSLPSVREEHIRRIPGTDLALRREIPLHWNGLPNNPDALRDLVAEWYLPQLAKLASLGISSLAHQSYVVDRTADNKPPELFTVTPFLPDLLPLLGYGSVCTADTNPQHIFAAQKLAAALRHYYARADMRGETPIGDLYYVQQYHPAGDDASVPVLHDLDHCYGDIILGELKSTATSEIQHWARQLSNYEFVA